MPNKYKDLVVHEVSLVDRAANKRRFAMLKSEDNLSDTDIGGSPPNLTEPSEEVNMNEEEIKALVATQVANALAIQKAELEAKAEEEKEEAIRKAREAIDSEKDLELKKAAEELAELRKAEELRKEAIYIEKAEKLSNLGVDSGFGKVLKAVADSLPEESSKIEEILLKASETIGNSDLLDEVGSQGEGDGVNSLSTIDSEAKRLREQNASLTQEQAIAKALELNPNLYNEYLKGE